MDNIEEHKKTFVSIRSDLLAEWEENNNEQWPKYGKAVMTMRGRVVRAPENTYNVLKIIPLACGGPLTWFNIHPASWPEEIQAIHRPDGVWQKLFGKLFNR